MPGDLFPLLFVIGAAIAVAIVVLGVSSGRRRQQAFRLAAVKLGLTYLPEDPFGLVDLPFELLQRGDGRGVENVLSGTWHGLEVQVFDYWYYVERSSGKSRSRTTYRFECVVGRIDARCPHLTIAEENLLSRIADALALDDLQFESEAFNRAFNVRGDQRFGITFCDARMMDWLLDNGADRIFEVHEGRMLLACDRLDPNELEIPLTAFEAWRAQVPRAVSSLYPR